MDSATLYRVIGAAAVLAVVFVVFRLVRSGAKQPGAHHSRMECGTCGWTGTVSKHKSRCARCGGTVLTPVSPAGRR